MVDDGDAARREYAARLAVAAVLGKCDTTTYQTSTRSNQPDRVAVRLPGIELHVNHQDHSMTARRIILRFLIAGTACLFWPVYAHLAADEPASTGASAATSSAADDAVPHVACGPTPYVIVPQPAPGPNGPYLVQPPPAAWIQPAPPVEVVPLVPLPQSAGPLQGPMFAAPPVAPQPVPAPAPAVGPLANIAPGGAISPEFGLPAGPEPLPGFANPMLIPITNDELAWEQITSVVTDYFTIAREQQARRNNLEWAEGRIETAPLSGATMFEPFRHDSVRRLQSLGKYVSDNSPHRRSARDPQSRRIPGGSDRAKGAGEPAPSRARDRRLGHLFRRRLAPDQAAPAK